MLDIVSYMSIIVVVKRKGNPLGGRIMKATNYFKKYGVFTE